MKTSSSPFLQLRLGNIPFGVFALVGAFLCTFSVVRVSSVDVVRNMVATSQNQTIMVDNINATGELIKRVGEFASRALWMKKRKFVLPAGTILSLAPKITIPAFRRKAFKGGLNSDFQATWYFYINCDKLGFTDNMHPFPFDRPPFYPFGPLMRPIESKDYPGAEENKDDKNKMKPKPQKHSGPEGGHHGMHHHPMHPMHPPHKGQHLPPIIDENGVDSYKSGLKGDTVYTFFPIHKRTGEAEQGGQQRNKAGGASRKPRSIMSLPPPDKLPGGERAVLLPSIENLMNNFGFEGKGCMLRAICEIHEYPLQNGYGLIGEMVALFFSISQSPYAESHMPEYLKAEEAGRTGDCSRYRSQCAKSIFRWEKVNKQEEELETNEVPLTSPYRSKFEDDEL